MTQANPLPSDARRPDRGRARYEVPEEMRSDVRLLGDLLGQVLSEYPSPGLLSDVEHLREMVIAAVEDPAGDDLSAAEELVESFGRERAEEVARAFTCYFLLSNLAEERHRVRALRAREGTVPVAEQKPSDSIAAALHHLAEEVGEEEARRRLDGLEFHPVLTAHPTEARRRAISEAVRRIGTLLVERDDPRVGPGAQEENRRRLLVEVDTLWRTAQLRSGNPSPIDEVRTAMTVFDASLFDVVPRVYRRMEDRLAGEQSGLRKPQVPAMVRLGSWIGADRDGNPNVTAKVTREAAGVANQHVLAALEKAARTVAGSLTLTDRFTPPSEGLQALWLRQRRLSEELTEEISGGCPGESHRRVMAMVAERLAATQRRDADLAYGDAAELAADLAVVQESLVAADAPRAAYGALQRLVWQVQTYGFHLAELEVRQHSKVHAQTLAWTADPDSVPEPAVDPQEVLEVFRTMATLQSR
ncbi:phosphoenolpyruvate carboxylase, partial [Georgenia sp. 10Sc9-8]|nr:phosphoenolpyruvate carboxylase [Georgenia halotolerans]